MQFKNLGRYRTGGTQGKMELGIPVPKTPDGRVYRFSPNENAQPRHFVLGNPISSFSKVEGARARMKLEPGSNQTVCPYSGFIDEDKAFTHPDDVKAATKIVGHAAISDVEAELVRMFSGFNSRQSRNSPIRMEMKVKPRHRPQPRFARHDLMRELICDHCGRDYGVFAIGLFCPDCGAPNLRLHFAREVELVGAQVDLAESREEAQRELAYRLLGNAHEDVLTAFEATLKTVYVYGMAQRPSGSPPMKAPKNDFQNIDKAKTRFAELGFDPFDCLDAAELELLSLNIQKRHVIGHNLSIMDERFAGLAANAKVGETVHLVGTDIRDFAAVSQKVIDRLDTWLGGAPSPTIGQSPLTLSLPTPETNIMSDEDIQLNALDLDLSHLARRIGLWIARENTDGMPSFVDEEKFKQAFAEEDSTQFSDAIAELETDGFITAHRGMGLKIPHIRPTVDLYVVFDPIAFASDPTMDAASLAEKVLAGSEAVGARDLHATTGWSARRFNPALKLVLSEIDSRHVSRAINNEYPTTHFHVDANDRVALKRFVQRTQ